MSHSESDKCTACHHNKRAHSEKGCSLRTCSCRRYQRLILAMT